MPKHSIPSSPIALSKHTPQPLLLPRATEGIHIATATGPIPSTPSYIAVNHTVPQPSGVTGVPLIATAGGQVIQGTQIALSHLHNAELAQQQGTSLCAVYVCMYASPHVPSSAS